MLKQTPKNGNPEKIYAHPRNGLIFCTAGNGIHWRMYPRNSDTGVLDCLIDLKLSTGRPLYFPKPNQKSNDRGDSILQPQAKIGNRLIPIRRKYPLFKINQNRSIVLGIKGKTGEQTGERFGLLKS